MRWVLLLVPLFFLFGCSSTYYGKDRFGADEFVMDSYKIREGKFSILEMEGKNSADLESNLLEEYKDTIHEEDVLQIALFHPTRSDLVQAVQTIGQQIGYRVVGGEVLLPDLPPVVVEGLTIKEAAEAIQKEYSSLISNVEIFVTYRERKVKKIELAGQVAVSHIPVDGKLRLFDALALAKIPPDANLFKSYVIREGKMLSVDLFKLIKEGDMTQNIVMRGGDKIYIAESHAASVMVMGEVGSERSLAVPSGRISLREALAEARGIPYTGDKGCIFVIRGNIQKPKIYQLNWEHVIHLPNDSLLLMPGDIVYVVTKPITEWNRFISQLLPSFSGLEAASRSAGGVGVLVP
jgi:polysaccharide biosynthesis/export protein